MPRFEREPSEFVEKLVYLNRVSKTVKGGRVAKFSALMVVGDEKGRVKNMITVSLSGTTIPHEVIGEFGAGRVLMKPAAAGTGVIAGGPVRAVMEAIGIKDIRTKCLRSNNPQNVVSASSLEKDFSCEGTKTDAAKQVGVTVAERAKAKGIETVVFDRGGYVYHGRVKALAEGAREGGLQF